MTVSKDEARKAAERARAKYAPDGPEIIDKPDRTTKPGGNGTAKPRIWTSAELLAEEFPEPRFIVPEIVPEGLMLLAGRPKLGKSWLLLGWAHAITSNTPALGSITCDQGEALVLALEDSPRRIKGRLRTLGVRGNGHLEVTLQWPRTDEGGIDDLIVYLDKHPACRLVGVDTLAKIRPRTSKHRDAYQADVDALEPLQQLAADRHIGIICATHTRKASADDWLDAVTGTSGVTGTADTIAVLKRERGQADAFLFGDGRDVRDYEIPLRFDEGIWRKLEMSAPEARATSEQSAILRVLRGACGAGLMRHQIAKMTDRSNHATSNMLRRMEEAGLVEVKGNLWHLTV
jgi:hypothetical protein